MSENAHINLGYDSCMRGGEHIEALRIAAWKMARDELNYDFHGSMYIEVNFENRTYLKRMLLPKLEGKIWDYITKLGEIATAEPELVIVHEMNFSEEWHPPVLKAWKPLTEKQVAVFQALLDARAKFWEDEKRQRDDERLQRMKTDLEEAGYTVTKDN